MEVDLSDRISNLPEHIVHHILSFLTTKDVIVIGTLSKTFLSLSNSFPVLDFDFNYFPPDTITSDEFLNYVNARCLQYNGASVLQKFQLSVCGPLPDVERFDRAVTFAVENRVKDLSLSVFRSISGDGKFGPGRPLPGTVFAKSIIKLNLCGFELEKFNEVILGCPLLEELKLSSCVLQEEFNLSGSVIKSIHLHNLQGLKRFRIESPRLEFFHFSFGSTLWDSVDEQMCKFLNLHILRLHCVPLTDRWFEGVVSHLPVLETIMLFNCYELRKFKISNDNLRRIDLVKLDLLEVIEVRATKLESFMYNGWSQKVSIDIRSCKHLKNLHLSGYGIPEEFLLKELSTFVELDTLFLSVNSFPGMVEINLDYLRILTIYYSMPVNIEINAPRLVSFNYYGNLKPFISISNAASTLDISLWILPEGGRDISYFLKWLHFVQLLGPCRVLMIQDYRHEALIFPEELRKMLRSPLMNVKHIVVNLTQSATVTEGMVDSLLWLSPYLETLVVNWFYPGNMLLSLKFKYEMTMNGDYCTICRLGIPVECAYLRTVEIENCRDDDEKDKLLKYFKGIAKSVTWK